jgi:hypothetical protein
MSSLEKSLDDSGALDRGEVMAKSLRYETDGCNTAAGP